MLAIRLGSVEHSGETNQATMPRSELDELLFEASTVGAALAARAEGSSYDDWDSEETMTPLLDDGLRIARALILADLYPYSNSKNAVEDPGSRPLTEQELVQYSGWLFQQCENAVRTYSNGDVECFEEYGHTIDYTRRELLTLIADSTRNILPLYVQDALSRCDLADVQHVGNTMRGYYDLARLLDPDNAHGDIITREEILERTIQVLQWVPNLLVDQSTLLRSSTVPL